MYLPGHFGKIVVIVVMYFELAIVANFKLLYPQSATVSKTLNNRLEE